MTPPRLLVLGAGRGQVGLLTAARGLGYHVLTASLTHHKPPGLALADEVIDVDISDPDAVLDAVRDLSIDGVATSCIDTPIRALAAVAQQHSLRGVTPEAARVCTDKIAMKTVLAEHRIPTARFRTITAPQEATRAVRELGLPVVVKAPDLQGSAGVFICHTRQDVDAAIASARTSTSSESLIIEEFIEGTEFGAQAFVLDGEVLFVMVHDDMTVQRATMIPVGHSVPSALQSTTLAEAERVVRAAVEHLGLDDCAVNVDLIDRDGVVHVIEIACRVGANALAEITGIHLGLDYYELIARAAVDDDPKRAWSERKGGEAAAARMLGWEGPRGRLHSVPAVDIPSSDTSTAGSTNRAAVTDVSWFVAPGDEIRTFETSNDCIGQIVVHGSDVAACHALLEHVTRSVAIDVDGPTLP